MDTKWAGWATPGTSATSDTAPLCARAHNADLAALAVGIGAGAVVGTGYMMTAGTWTTPGGTATALGTLSALLGTYLCLVLLLLIARLPWIEREVGQDRLIAMHRRFGPWALVLIVAHVALTTIGYAQASKTGLWAQLISLVTTYPWMVPATVAFIAMVALGLASIPAIRHRLAYETWWAGHLYFYLAVALAFGHQLTSGTIFSSHTLLRTSWVGLYVVVGLAILWGRVWLPLRSSLRHDLRVDRVEVEGPGVVSIYISGKKLPELNALGGQFFQWRFMTRHWWWQAHPYSLSAGANGSWLRITVKDLGDQSGRLSDLRPGTRVIAEGPYGTFTALKRRGTEVVCFAAGVGITPIRALLDDLPAGTNMTLVYRVRDLTPGDVALRDELEAIVLRRGWEIVYLLGGRDEHPMTVDYLTSVVPELPQSDVYVCGPGGFTDSVCAAVKAMGVPDSRLHHESFAF